MAFEPFSVFPLQPVRLTDFKVPGAELEGLNYLRDIKDADALVASVKQIKETGGKVQLVTFCGCIKCLI